MTQRIQTFLKKPKTLVSIGVLVLLIILISLSSQTISITNREDKHARATTRSSRELLSGLTPPLTLSDSLDPASQVFLEKKPIVSEENKKEIVRYINRANEAIPLTTEALRFALIELILGEYNPVRDVLVRLGEGKLNLQEIEPPLDALTFHTMSIALLEEYKKVLQIPLAIPRDQFDPSHLEDDFERLQTLIGIAKHELQIIKERYGIPLFPKSILFYDEAIGIR